jgi:hypothetical protein
MPVLFTDGSTPDVVCLFKPEFSSSSSHVKVMPVSTVYPKSLH